MEELLLRLQLLGQELDVVDEQYVGVSEARAKRARVAAAHGAHELAREVLDGRVAHGQAVAVGLHVVADRVQEVGLAEPRTPVYEERVVGLRRLLGDRQGGAVGQAVAVADHEAVERVARVEDRDRRVPWGGRGLGGRLPARGDDLHRVGRTRALRRPPQERQIAVGDPRPDVLGGAEEERPSDPAGRRQRLEPDVEGEVRDLAPQLSGRRVPRAREVVGEGGLEIFGHEQSAPLRRAVSVQLLCVEGPPWSVPAALGTPSVASM